MKGLNNLEMRDTPNTGRGKRLGQQIWESVMNTRTRKPNQGTDIFTFGRAAYVVNLSAPLVRNYLYLTNQINQFPNPNQRAMTYQLFC